MNFRNHRKIVVVDGALGEFGDYVLLGASIVIPIFIILRLFNYRS